MEVHLVDTGAFFKGFFCWWLNAKTIVDWNLQPATAIWSAGLAVILWSGSNVYTHHLHPQWTWGCILIHHCGYCWQSTVLCVHTHCNVDILLLWLKPVSTQITKNVCSCLGEVIHVYTQVLQHRIVSLVRSVHYVYVWNASTGSRMCTLIPGMPAAYTAWRIVTVLWCVWMGK